MGKKQKKKKGKAGEGDGLKIVCRNRKARYLYDILDDLECGIVLRGSEVKSIRNGKMSIDEGYARVQRGELWLVGSDIAEYPQATVFNHEPKRTRKLLLHRREFHKFAEAAEQKGLTLVPLQVYFKNGRVKVSVAIARGRKVFDKREKIRKETDRREMRVAVSTK